MIWDDLTPGEAWVIETLTNTRDLRGWVARLVTPDPNHRGLLHVELTDRYGHAYRYTVHIEVDE